MGNRVTLRVVLAVALIAVAGPPSVAFAQLSGYEGIVFLTGFDNAARTDTFTVGPNTTLIYVDAIAPGGGGGGGATTSTASGGGGGGSGGTTIEQMAVTVTPGETLTFQLGAGGHGGDAGQPGQAGSAPTILKHANSNVILSIPPGNGGLGAVASGATPYSGAGGNAPGSTIVGGTIPLGGAAAAQPVAHGVMGGSQFPYPGTPCPANGAQFAGAGGGGGFATPSTPTASTGGGSCRESA